jgi:hypothetical protein
MYDKRQRGIQEAMGRIGMNNQRENPYSPFGGNVPQQSLQEIGDRAERERQNTSMIQQDPTRMADPRAGQLPPQAAPQSLSAVGRMPQQPIPRAPMPNMAPPIPQQRPMPDLSQNPRLAKLMQNPRFMEMLRRRRGGMR